VPLLLAENEVRLEYRGLKFRKRRAVLRDTVEKFSEEGATERYMAQTLQNHQRWTDHAKGTPGTVRVMAGDWGDVTHHLSATHGHVYAVLNMANAYHPGGGYLEGMPAQEENMWYRTNCSFFLKEEEMTADQHQYTLAATDLINGVQGSVYLDVTKPRLCIKGSEGSNVTGYADLGSEDYYSFYELKSAADDLRVESSSFSEESMRSKIVAQLETLKKNGIRHAVLSAFGCGAFLNPAEEVARIYKEELQKRAEDFDDVVFAVYHAGYGSNNFLPFKTVLEGLPLNQTQLAQQKELVTVLTQTVTDKEWDQCGIAFLFFDYRKTPNGIVDIRQVLASDQDDFSKIRALKKIAQYRLDNPPIFTPRDGQVQALYEQIVKIDVHNMEAALQLFTVDDQPQDVDQPAPN